MTQILESRPLPSNRLASGLQVQPRPLGLSAAATAATTAAGPPIASQENGGLRTSRASPSLYGYIGY